MHHHPDRNGDAAKFMEVKEAYEYLYAMTDTSYKTREQSFSNGYFEQMAAAMRAQADQYNTYGYDEYDDYVYKDDAWKEVSLPLASLLNGTIIFTPEGKIKIPKGSYGNQVLSSEDGQVHKVRINPVLPDGCVWKTNINDGDLLMTVECGMLIPMLGGNIGIQIIDGNEVSVRVPAGFDISHQLRVKDKGFIRYINGKVSNIRGNLFIKLHPIFKPLNKMDSAELNMLKSAVDYELAKDK